MPDGGRSMCSFPQLGILAPFRVANYSSVFLLETVSHHKRRPINKAAHYYAGRFLREGTVCLRGVLLFEKTLMWKRNLSLIPKK